MNSIRLCLSVFFIVALFNIAAAEKAGDVDVEKIYYQPFPCIWKESLKVTQFSDEVFHCIQVDVPSVLTYKSITTANDSYQLFVLDAENYANYREDQPFNCINGSQCRLKDKSVKHGTYNVNQEGIHTDFFIVVRNSNLIQRSFVDVDIVLKPTNE